MGGYGSGRTSKAGRRPRKSGIIEQCPCLNSFKAMPSRIAKENGSTLTLIGPYSAEATKDWLQVYYGKGLAFETPMQAVSSGWGKRYYFTCPDCGTRTSRLYLYGSLTCRKCHNLSYYSQNISNEDRWLYRRERLLERYGLSFDEVRGGIKKKGMHQKTFDRVVREFNFLSDTGIDVHIDRSEYPRALKLLRAGRKAGKYCVIHADDTLSFLGEITKAQL